MSNTQDLSLLGSTLTSDGNGADVTGSVTADGITSVVTTDTQGKFSGWSLVGANSSSGAIELGPNSAFQGVISYAADASTRFLFDNTYGSTASTFEFRTNTAATAKTHLKILGSGDINLGYEATGTTPKLFWDASDESLIIGSGVNTYAKLTVATEGTSVGSTIRLVGTNTIAGASQVSHITSYQPTGGADGDAALDFKVRGGVDPFATPSTVMTLLGGGNVGIGTVDPTTKLEVASSIARTDTVTPDTATAKFANNLNDGLAFGHYLSSPFGSWIQSGYLLDGHPTEWNAGYPISLNPEGGSVGIGTSSPVTALDVRGEISVDYDATYGLRFYNEDRNNWSSIGNTTATGNSSANLVFKTSLGEAMRIDSAGLLMVSTSVDFASGTVDGIIAQGTNKPAAAFSNTAEGQIVKFYEGASLVGSIGTESGGIYLGSPSGAGKYFANNGNFSPSTNGSKNLGDSLLRWQDLHLSGGVVFGDAGGSGTSSSNTLDSYEEGTFTPTVIGGTTAGTATYSHQKGVYTKIGRAVTVQIYLNWSSGTGAGNLRISNLPFTQFSSSGYYANAAIGEHSNISGTAGHTLCGIGLPGTVNIQFSENDFNSAPTITTYDAAGYIILTMTYMTD